ncbi:MAG: aminoglycoside N(3)-acetyltransferase [Alphaproteobacteria bacterium]
MAISADDLCRDLRALGLDAGAALVVHVALRQIGWVAGGAASIIHALMVVLTPAGTLVMPTFSERLCDPAEWYDPPAPAGQVAIIRAEMQLFDPVRTPTQNMGAVAETFRTCPGVHRSHHPMQSLAAWGRGAEELTAGHELDWPLGPGSPLDRLCEMGGQVLLIGVGHNRNSTLHLAETRARHRRTITRRMPVARDGGGIDWVETDDVADDNGRLFPALGAAFEATGQVRVGAIGGAETRLMSQRALVDFAVTWFEDNLGAT